MIYALMKADAGTIVVDGVDAVTEPQRAQAQLGVLPDVSGLYPRLTAREHIVYFGQLHGLAGQTLEARTHQLLLQREKIIFSR